MAKNKKAPTYKINAEGPNILIAEEGNSAYMLRQVSWNGRPEKIELRKWITTPNGEELPGKGFSFRDRSKLDEIVEGLAQNNFGNTKILLQNIRDREDFESALVHTIGQQKVIQARNTEFEVDKDEYYDPRNLI